MKKQLTQAEVVALLRQRCQEAGSQKNFANTNDISAQYVTDVLNQRREPGEAILSALGLRKVISYKVKQ
jgi:hypothetical protein